jgi:hypothetical protein
MDKKFELTDITKEVYGRTVYQIRALKDFGTVKAGDLGGWLEDEKILNQEGDGWVFKDAVAFKLSIILGGEIWGGEIWGGVIRGGEIRGGEIELSTDYMIFGPIGSRKAILTVTFSDMKMATGCFHGPISEFREKLKNTHSGNQHEIEYNLILEVIEKLIESRKNGK